MRPCDVALDVVSMIDMINDLWRIRFSLPESESKITSISMPKVSWPSWPLVSNKIELRFLMFRYTAIRCAKLHLLQVAFPSAPQSDLLHRLPKDFAREGWLWKTGPRPTDAHRRRWFTLDNRKLMYHDEPLDAYPKGEIFIGKFWFTSIPNKTVILNILHTWH